MPSVWPHRFPDPDPIASPAVLSLSALPLSSRFRQRYRTTAAALSTDMPCQRQVPNTGAAEAARGALGSRDAPGQVFFQQHRCVPRYGRKRADVLPTASFSRKQYSAGRDDPWQGPKRSCRSDGLGSSPTVRRERETRRRGPVEDVSSSQALANLAAVRLLGACMTIHPEFFADPDTDAPAVHGQGCRDMASYMVSTLDMLRERSNHPAPSGDSSDSDGFGENGSLWSAAAPRQWSVWCSGLDGSDGDSTYDEAHRDTDTPVAGRRGPRLALPLGRRSGSRSPQVPEAPPSQIMSGHDGHESDDATRSLPGGSSPGTTPGTTWSKKSAADQERWLYDDAARSSPYLPEPPFRADSTQHAARDRVVRRFRSISRKFRRSSSKSSALLPEPLPPTPPGRERRRLARDSDELAVTTPLHPVDSAANIGTAVQPSASLRRLSDTSRRGAEPVPASSIVLDPGELDRLSKARELEQQSHTCQPVNAVKPPSQTDDATDNWATTTSSSSIASAWQPPADGPATSEQGPVAASRSVIPAEASQSAQVAHPRRGHHRSGTRSRLSEVHTPETATDDAETGSDEKPHRDTASGTPLSSEPSIPLMTVVSPPSSCVKNGDESQPPYPAIQIQEPPTVPLRGSRHSRCSTEHAETPGFMSDSDEEMASLTALLDQAVRETGIDNCASAEAVTTGRNPSSATKPRATEPATVSPNLIDSVRLISSPSGSSSGSQTTSPDDEDAVAVVRPPGPPTPYPARYLGPPTPGTADVPDKSPYVEPTRAPSNPLGVRPNVCRIVSAPRLRHGSPDREPAMAGLTAEAAYGHPLTAPARTIHADLPGLADVYTPTAGSSDGADARPGVVGAKSPQPRPAKFRRKDGSRVSRG